MIRANQLKLMRITILDRNITEMAADLGVNRMKVKRIETGESKTDPKYLQRFSKTYGIKPETAEALRELERAIEKAQRQG